jgi:16S rRNA (guanine966-N2)-methyltransferase
MRLELMTFSEFGVPHVTMHDVEGLRAVALRITGGECRGRVITGPEGLEIRPTASKIRQAFFNIISNRITDGRFVDVCAGSGLMGMEALSRGAGSLIAIEDNRKFAQAIESNCQRFGFKERSEVICGDLRKVLPLLNSYEADVIFADPPYKSQLAEPILRIVDKNHLLADDGILVIEHAISLPPPEIAEELEMYDRRKYGHTALSFFRTRSKD